MITQIEIKETSPSEKQERIIILLAASATILTLISAHFLTLAFLRIRKPDAPKVYAPKLSQQKGTYKITISKHFFSYIDSKNISKRLLNSFEY